MQEVFIRRLVHRDSRSIICVHPYLHFVRYVRVFQVGGPEDIPLEIVLAQAACHVGAAAVLYDVGAAVGAITGVFVHQCVPDEVLIFLRVVNLFAYFSVVFFQTVHARSLVARRATAAHAICLCQIHDTEAISLRAELLVLVAHDELVAAEITKLIHEVDRYELRQLIFVRFFGADTAWTLRHPVETSEEVLDAILEHSPQAVVAESIWRLAEGE